MNRERTTGAILIVSENTDPIQVTRATGALLKHDDVVDVIVEGRSWNSAVQDQILRLPKLFPQRVVLSRTSDPLQELRRRIPAMVFTIVVDSLSTLAEDTVEAAVGALTSPGEHALVAAIRARPRWAGAIYRTEQLARCHGIDLVDHRSKAAVLRSDGWRIEKGLEIRERPVLELGPESLRRLPDLFTRLSKPLPRAGNEVVTFKSRRRTRR